MTFPNRTEWHLAGEEAVLGRAGPEAGEAEADVEEDEAAQDEAAEEDEEEQPAALDPTGGSMELDLQTMSMFPNCRSIYSIYLFHL